MKPHCNVNTYLHTYHIVYVYSYSQYYEQPSNLCQVGDVNVKCRTYVLILTELFVCYTAASVANDNKIECNGNLFVIFNTTLLNVN